MLVILAALAGAMPPLVVSMTAVTVETRTVVRVVRRRAPVTPPPPPVFKEKHGPHCIAADDISAAAVTGPAQVDFALKGGLRVRAQLEDECPALDFYRGFYLPPTADAKICAGRDVIRTRAGGECQIDRFRKLQMVDPAPPTPSDPPKTKHRP